MAIPTHPTELEYKLMDVVGHDIANRAETIRDTANALTDSIAKNALASDIPAIHFTGTRAMRQAINLIEAVDAILDAAHGLEHDAEAGLEDLERIADNPDYPN